MFIISVFYQLNILIQFKVSIQIYNTKNVQFNEPFEKVNIILCYQKFIQTLIDRALQSFMNCLKLEYISPREVKITPTQLVEKLIPSFNRAILSFVKKFEIRWNAKFQHYVIPMNGVLILEKAIESLNDSGMKSKIKVDDCPIQGKNILMNLGSKIKKNSDKLLVYDPLQSERYSFMQKNISGLKIGYHTTNIKILIICPQHQKQNWINRFSAYECKEYVTHAIYRPVQLITFDKLGSFLGSLDKFNPDQVFMDCGECLSQFDSLYLNIVCQFLKKRNKTNIFVSTLDVSWKLTYKFLEILKPTIFTQESWFKKRYESGNYQELKYLLDNTILEEIDSEENISHDLVYIKLPKSYFQSIKSIKIDTQLLSTTICAKIQGIFSYLYLMKKKRCLIVTNMRQFEKKISAFFCESQIQFLNYQSVSQFNKDLSQRFCLINVGQIAKKRQVWLSEISQVFDTRNRQNFMSSGSSEITFNSGSSTRKPLPFSDSLTTVEFCRHIIFVDFPWRYNEQQHQIIDMILTGVKRSYVKHFCVASKTYEVQLCKAYSTVTIQSQRAAFKRKIRNQNYERETEVKKLIEEIDNIEQVQKDKQNSKIQNSLYDIDEEFDRLQFHILQQKQFNPFVNPEKPLYEIQQEIMKAQEQKTMKENNYHEYGLQNQNGSDSKEQTIKSEQQIEQLVIKEFLKHKNKSIQDSMRLMNIQTVQQVEPQQINRRRLRKNRVFEIEQENQRDLDQLQNILKAEEFINSKQKEKKTKKQIKSQKIQIMLIEKRSRLRFD